MSTRHANLTSPPNRWKLVGCSKVCKITSWFKRKRTKKQNKKTHRSQRKRRWPSSPLSARGASEVASPATWPLPPCSGPCVRCLLSDPPAPQRDGPSTSPRSSAGRLNYRRKKKTRREHQVLRTPHFVHLTSARREETWILVAECVQDNHQTKGWRWQEAN